MNWYTIALNGDQWAVPEPVPVFIKQKWRPGKVSIAVLVLWLAWEAAGLVRALTVGPEILGMIWEMRP